MFSAFALAVSALAAEGTAGAKAAPSADATKAEKADAKAARKAAGTAAAKTQTTEGAPKSIGVRKAASKDQKAAAKHRNIPAFNYRFPLARPNARPGTTGRRSPMCRAGSSDRVRQDLACAVNRYNDPKELNLGLTDAQRAGLVEYLKLI